MAARLPLLGAGLAAVAIAYLSSRHLPALPSTLLTSVLLARGSVASGRTRTPWRWWSVVGACCGSLLCTAMVVAQKIHSDDHRPGLRHQCLGSGSLWAGCT